jgi:hypothetical protein
VFLQCQILTSAVRLKVEGCRMKNGGCKNKSEEIRVINVFLKDDFVCASTVLFLAHTLMMVGSSLHYCISKKVRSYSIF